MTTISNIQAIEVLDSRGNPTVEVHLQLDNTHRGRAIVPSGASTGIYEALERRDNDSNRYHGKGVRDAVAAIHDTIAPQLIGQSYSTIKELDTALIDLDGTPNKKNLGANALLGVSMARCVASAKAAGVPLFAFLGSAKKLPIPTVNVMNGGAHALSGIDIQECMLVPVGADSFAEGIRRCTEVFHTLKKLLKEKWHPTTVGDEGGFAPSLDSLDEALTLMTHAIQQSGYSTDQIKFALDVAASELYKDGLYHFAREGVTRTGDELIAFYKDLVEQHPVISIEDGFGEEDYATRTAGTAALGDTVMMVGDDLFVTNSTRLQQGIDQRQANAILIKLNQIGTVSETLETIQLAQDNNIATIISHRSGETEDTFIADLAVATGAGRIKTGSTSRTDRTAKYNQLLRIEQYLAGNFPIW